jgi:hypothetical protein
MKKAKIMLSAIALVAVVGAAVASKAKSSVILYTLSADQLTCNKVGSVVAGEKQFLNAVTIDGATAAHTATSICTVEIDNVDAGE